MNNDVEKKKNNNEVRSVKVFPVALRTSNSCKIVFVKLVFLQYVRCMREKLLPVLVQCSGPERIAGLQNLKALRYLL